MYQIDKSKNFEKYWLNYLASHKDPINRMCHYMRTIFGLFGSLLLVPLVHLSIEWSASSRNQFKTEKNHNP